MTAHTFMLQETIEDLFEVEDVQRLWEATAHEVTAATDQESAKDRNMLAQMRKMIQARDKPIEAADPQRSSDTLEVDDPISEESRPLVFKFRRILRELAASSKWDALTTRSLCHQCKDVPSEPWITSCLHLYCKVLRIYVPKPLPV